MDSAATGLAPERGSVVVCIAVPRDDASTIATLRSVLAHCGTAVPVILAGPAAALERVMTDRDVESADRERLTPLAGRSVDPCALLNAAARAAAPADAILLAPGVLVAAEWLGRLRAAATEDSTVASATPLSLGGGGVELLCEEEVALIASRAGCDEPNMPWAQAGALEDLARSVRERSLRLRPRIARMGPACVYLRRSAWDLAGPLELGRPLGDALASLADCLSSQGMLHVLADDVLIGAAGGEAIPAELGAFEQASANDERGPLRRALDRGRTALRPMSVTIDARSLTAAVGGTQTYVTGLVLALAEERAVSVRVLVAPDLAPSTTAAFADAPGVELLSYADALRAPPLSDVVHRPQQVFTPDDLTLLRFVGRRIVVGQQDLIAYHDHAYHRDTESWRAYRRTTRLALAAVDQVVFFSGHARRDALAEDLVEPTRAHVVGIGADAPMGTVFDSTSVPAGLGAEDRFLLCLGADYAHKNRPFAIELLGALLEAGWDGRLVLAGAHVPYGSSGERERELLAADARLAERVLDLGAVGEPGKRWLYAHASALLYPTTYEGFGLIVAEAARIGLPCLYAAQASLAEVAPAAATLVPWDPVASAQAVLPLLDPGPAREEHLRRLGELAAPSWGEAVRGLLAVYEQALAAPAPAAAPRAWQELDREAYIVQLDRDMAHLKEIAQEYQDVYHDLDERVRFGLALVDRDGLLSHNQQRALMRIAHRGWPGRALLAPLGLLGRGRRRP